MAVWIWNWRFIACQPFVLLHIKFIKFCIPLIRVLLKFWDESLKFPSWSSFFFLLGITRPLSHRPRKGHTRALLGLIWAASTLFAAPLLVLYQYGVVTQVSYIISATWKWSLCFWCHLILPIGWGGDPVLLRVLWPPHDDQPLLCVQLSECEPPVPDPPPGHQLLLCQSGQETLVVSNPRPSESQHRHPGTLFDLEHYTDNFGLMIAA